jgi:protoheme IX farnesyltransferase
MNYLTAYLSLTKPRILVLILFTGATALLLQGDFSFASPHFGGVLLALYLTGGSANGLNQYFERRVDSLMSRTRWKRPLPMGLIRPAAALWFSIAIGLMGVVLLLVFYTWQAAAYATFTIFFYSIIYTLYLKPSTPWSTVIGGLAGALVPVGAWAAADPQLQVIPWLLFLIVFFWSPPHFWALGLHLKADYESSPYPMMPKIYSREQATRIIMCSTIILAGVGLLPILLFAGSRYFIISLLVNGIYVYLAVRNHFDYSSRRNLLLFKYSLIYLFVMFGALIFDYNLS